MKYFWWIACFLLACGGMGGPEGGAAHLPERGIVGWEGDADNNLLNLPDISGALGKPHAYLRDGKLGLWFQRKDADGTWLCWAETQNLDWPLVFSAPHCPIEDGSSPSFLLGEDKDLLAFERDGDIYLQELQDGEALGGAKPLLSGESPSLLRSEDGALWLYYLQDGALSRLVLSQALEIERSDEVLFSLGKNCLDKDGKAVLCWDEGGLLDIELRAAKTAASRSLYRGFYSAKKTATAKLSLGFTASYDGMHFESYLDNPVFDEKDLAYGTALMLEEGQGTVRYLLFLEDLKAKGIRLFSIQSHAPSEWF